jgi:hypothetical protein
MTPGQIADGLTIPPSSSVTVIEFPTARRGVGFRRCSERILGLLAGGRTAGGAREFVLPNGRIPDGSLVRRVEQ